MTDKTAEIGYVMVKGESYDMSTKDGVVIDEIDFVGGWDVNEAVKALIEEMKFRKEAGEEIDGFDYDIDISASILDGEGENAQVLGKPWIVFPWNKSTPGGEFKLDKDNRTGEGEGPDETISGKLSSLPPNARCVRYFLNIHLGKERDQNFGMVNNLFVAIIDKKTGKELCRYAPGKKFSRHRAMIVAEHFLTDEGVWQFRAVGTAIIEPSDIKTEYRKIGIPIQ